MVCVCVLFAGPVLISPSTIYIYFIYFFHTGYKKTLVRLEEEYPSITFSTNFSVVSHGAWDTIPPMIQQEQADLVTIGQSGLGSVFYNFSQQYPDVAWVSAKSAVGKNTENFVGVDTRDGEVCAFFFSSFLCLLSYFCVRTLISSGDDPLVDHHHMCVTPPLHTHRDITCWGE